MKKRLLTVAMAALSLFAGAQTSYKVMKYDGTSDFGILMGLTDNGRWGIIQNGSSSSGGTARPQVFNTETGKAEDRAKGMWFNTVNDDATIAVGTSNGMPAVYNEKTGKVTTFPLRTNVISRVKDVITGRDIVKERTAPFVGGVLNHVTPDGKYAVGLYTTTDEMQFAPLAVNVETGDTIYTPGLPVKDMSGRNQEQNWFTDITPDGRYILGALSFSYYEEGLTYLYDTETHTYDVIGFEKDATGKLQGRYPGLLFVDHVFIGGNGRYLTGEAYVKPDRTVLGNEYSLPFRYDMQTMEFTVFDQQDLRGKIAYGIDAAGTMLISTGDKGGAATPLRDFSVLYNDKYPISFSTICQQYYGFDFRKRVGYENTGTPTGFTSDGTKFVSFSDPQGESYFFDLGQPIEEICSQIDLLANYSVNPVSGSEFAKIGTVTLTFDRAVQVIGEYDNVSLLNSKGETVAHASSSGFTVNPDNNHQIWVQFSARGGANVLTSGEQYTLVIDAGSISIEGDVTVTNKEIRIDYKGRSAAPVKMMSVTPAAHSQLAMIDGSSSYVTLTFDTKVIANSKANATLQRADGTILSYLTTYYGGNEVSLLATGTYYLYAGLDYYVVLNAGCITDASGDESSANEEIRIPYHGIYERPVAADGVVFSSDFNNMSESLNTWMRFDGDGRTPTAEMQSWLFDAKNEAWNFSIRDDNSTDVCAASHSMYDPVGRSHDIMMSPQMEIPNDDQVTLEFDAQSYLKSKHDELKVLVWACDTQYNLLDEATVSKMENEATEVFSEVLSPGATETDLTDEWTHYSVNLGQKFKGKNIYLIFFNGNNNQSAIFVDNVVVKRDMFYKMQFSNEDMFVAADDVTIKGKFAVTTTEAANSIVTLSLYDGNGTMIDTQDFDECVVDELQEFEFNPLPLTVGIENNYSIKIKAGEKEDTYKGVITNLAFQTTKHVALEEVTGQGCTNCPLGIVTIEKLRAMYGKQIIPMSLHTYTGDQLGAGIQPYASYLGLSSAPSALIDRLPRISFPIVSIGTNYTDDMESEGLWLNLVAQQMNKLAPADVKLTAINNGSELKLDGEVTFALNYDNKQYNIFYVIMEDGVMGYQENGFFAVDQPILGEWGAGGIYAQSSVMNYVFEDVVRGTYGTSFAGTSGLIPTNIVAGKAYSINQTTTMPENILKRENVHVAMLLIDATTGQVANCIDSKLFDAEAICNIASTDKASQHFNFNGQRINSTAKGLVIVNGKKLVIR